MFSYYICPPPPRKHMLITHPKLKTLVCQLLLLLTKVNYKNMKVFDLNWAGIFKKVRGAKTESETPTNTFL